MLYLLHITYRASCEELYKEHEKRQEGMAEKLSKLQQEYQKAVIAAGGMMR